MKVKEGAFYSQSERIGDTSNSTQFYGGGTKQAALKLMTTFEPQHHVQDSLLRATSAAGINFPGYQVQ